MKEGIGGTSFLHVILGLHSIHSIVANRKRGLQGVSLLCHLILAIDNSMLRSKTKPLFLKSFTVREFFNFLKSHEPCSRNNKIIQQFQRVKKQNISALRHVVRIYFWPSWITRSQDPGNETTYRGLTSYIMIGDDWIVLLLLFKLSSE